MVADRWLGLEIRHLSALEAIAEEGSFAEAARRLGYTQSAVSQQIAALERIVDAKVVERANGRRPIGLTEDGRLVLRHGRAILARVDAARADLRARSVGLAGPLRVGTYPSVGARILPGLLPAFAHDWPDIELQLVESNADAELLSLVEEGALDLAFCMLPLAPGPFEAHELLRDPWLLVLPAPASTDGTAVTLRPGQPLLAFRTCPTTDELEPLLRRWGVDAKVVFRSDDTATLQALVAAGVGVAFMPCLTVDRNDAGTVVGDVRNDLPPRRVAIAWHRDRDRSAASRAFVEAAAQVSERLRAELENGPFVPFRPAPG